MKVFHHMLMKTKFILLLSLLIGNNLFSQKDCNHLNKGLIPLSDIGNKNYRGFSGGLFGNGKNSADGNHLNDGLLKAYEIKPLDTSGNANQNGLIGFIGVGASNPRTEFNAFIKITDTFSNLNPKLLFVNTCIGGQGIQKMKSKDDNYWKSALKSLDSLKLGNKQVQVAWIETDNTANGDTVFPRAPQNLAAEFQELLVTLKYQFPNLKICYFSGRAYSGFATPIQGGVGKGLLYPRDYYNGWAVRFLIDNEKNAVTGYDYKGTNATIPYSTWANYSWNDGKLPRKDGFFLDCDNDIGSDGLHLTVLGENKLGKTIFDFFTHDTTAKPWFLKQNNITSIGQISNNSMLLIYPNPLAGEDLFIECNPSDKLVHISIFSADGKLVSECNPDKSVETLKTSNLQVGIYFVVASLNNGKIIKQKLLKQN